MVNCWRGGSSIATSVLCVVPSVLRPLRTRAVLAGPPIPCRRADTGDCAVDVQHTGGNPEKEQHDHPPRPGTEPMIDRPAQSGRDTHRDHEFDADAEAEAEPLLQG